ncbi:MAG: cytochrome c [Bryobacterales bacterium]|nr:cytochrome c [Bryobacterales bacterium]
MKTPCLPIALACALALLSLGTALAADSTRNDAATYNEHVAKIMHERCASCHRPGQAAPFSLLTYEDAAKRAQLIGAVTGSRYMPPWHAEPGYGKFKGERRMTDREIATLAAWVEAGAPEGPGETPAPPTFPSGWILGEPDLVVSMEEPYTVPADGADVYRNFPARVPTTEDKWIRALQFRPQARTVVHHSLFKADTSGKAREFDARDETPGYSSMGPIPGRISLGGWAVGGQARVFPEGAPLRLPAGSDFLFESHFHPSGKEEVERSSIALYFTDEPASRSRVSFQLPPSFGRGAGIDVAPGDRSYTISESFTLPAAIELYGVTPHAHYIGKEFKSWAELPDGSEVPLIWIKDWDFAWQDMYVYEEPVMIPAGATIHSRIRYDNSAENPRNPSNPPKRVFWGRGSEDEMGSIIYTALPANERDAKAIRQAYSVISKRHATQAKEYTRARRAARSSSR